MEPISKEFLLEGSVSYWNVDQENLLTLRKLGVFAGSGNQARRPVRRGRPVEGDPGRFRR